MAANPLAAMHSLSHTPRHGCRLPDVAMALSIFGIAFAAFCVWLVVRGSLLERIPGREQRIRQGAISRCAAGGGDLLKGHLEISGTSVRA
jgi:hypothetical protein